MTEDRLAGDSTAEVPTSEDGTAEDPATQDSSAEQAAGDEGEPDSGAVPLLEPRDGLPAVVTTPQALAEAAQALARGTGPVAVDAERASGFRYGQRAFLVQFRRAGSGTVLVDPTGCPDLSGVDAALASAETVLHAAGQDLPCLEELGYRPRQLFDTELAGRLLGFPKVGLAALVEELLGLRLAKGHGAEDWSTRPLPEEWLRYAALDVEVLVELRDALAQRLDKEGKSEWARQEFAAVLATRPPRPRPDPWRRTSGIHRVRTRRGLAVVRELWLERDEIAQRRDLSPGRVLPDAAIIEAARALPKPGEDLTKLPGFTGRGARRHVRNWLAAVNRARARADAMLPLPSGPPVDGPPPTHRWAERDPAAARRLTAVRAAVAALADSNHMPTENLLHPDAVRRVSWSPPEPPTAEMIAAKLREYGARPWQVELATRPIARALARLEEKEDR